MKNIYVRLQSKQKSIACLVKLKKHSVIYKDKKAKIRPLIKAIEKFLANQEQDYFCRDTVNSFLVKELLSVLKGNKSNIVEGMYDDESPMDYTIIATKEFIERSLCSRYSANEQ